MRHLALAPRVEGVVDERRSRQECLVVRFNLQTTDPNRQEAGPGGVGVELTSDVGGVDNTRQAHECGVVGQTEVLEEHLERALVTPVGIRRTRCVKGVRRGRVGKLEDR